MTPTTPNLFRRAAITHYLQVEDGHSLVRVSPPWTWTLLCVLLAAVAGAILAACLGRVEVNGRARGMLRPVGGVRLLAAQVGGTIAEVAVHSGQRVRRGERLLSINSPLVQGQLLEARRQTATVRREFRFTSLEQDRAFAEQTRSLGSRSGKLQLQIASQAASVALFERQLNACQILEHSGILSRTRGDEAREALAQAQRQLSALEQALEGLSQEQAALEHLRQESLWQRQQTIQHAESHSASLAFQLDQTRIQAPQDGVVEAVLVGPGEAVQPGQPLGHLLSLEAPLEVVAFLAEKDRAFVRVGDEALLELDQLPYAEYGTIRARVLRISEFLASPLEIREALGDAQPPALATFRIELQILDARAAQAARVRLRPGMLTDVRFTLRRQRLATLVLDPLRKWLR